MRERMDRFEIHRLLNIYVSTRTENACVLFSR